MSFVCFFPYLGQTQPVLLCASVLALPHPVLPRFQHPDAAVGPSSRFRLASTHPLKLGPAVILSLHPEGANFFP